MAGNIKGIVIQFSGDTTRLDKALRQINNETKNIDKELRAVDKALKFNPTNVELWRQKQQLLSEKIAETKNKLEVLKQAQAKMDADGVDKNSEEYRKLQREIIETESKTKHYESELRKIGNVNLKAAGAQIQEMGNKLTAAGNAMKGVSMAAAAVTAAIGAATVKSAAWADDLNTMSKVYGISTGQLQMYSAAAELVDVDLETVTATHSKLTKQMASASDGTGASAEAFKTLGVSITNADGSLRDADTVWNETIAALGNVTNETERDTLAMQLMGKSAQELNPLIEDGGETYQNLADTLAKYDLNFIDQETLDNANSFNDSLDTIKAIGMVTFQQLGTTMASVLAPALEKVVDWVGQIANWLTSLSPETQAMIATIAAVLAVVAPLLLILGKFAFALNAIITIAPAVGTAITVMTGPVGLIIAAIAAVIAAGVLIYKHWDEIKAKGMELWEKIKEIFDGIKTKIQTVWENIKTTATTIWEGIKTAVMTPINALKNAVTKVWDFIKQTAINRFNTMKTVVTTIWNGIKTAITKPIETARNVIKTAIDKIKSIINGAHLKLPHFKTPHFNIKGGKLPWGIGGKGTPPEIKIEWYAKGGIFNSPSLIGVGEAGSEAVVPLDRFWRTLENMQTGNNIVININGAGDPRAVAEEVKRLLIRETNQRRVAWQ